MSLIDLEQRELSGDVWDRDDDSTNLHGDNLKYTLKPSVADDVFSLVGNIIPPSEASQIAIAGSITTPFWVEDSDIDVTLFITGIGDEELKLYRDLAVENNEKVFAGKHPINIFVRNDSLDTLGTDFSDGIYDVVTDTWIKSPVEIDDIYIYLQQPRELAMKIAAQLDIELDEVETDLRGIVDLLTNNQRWMWMNDQNLISHDYDEEEMTEKIASLEVDMDEYMYELDEIHQRRADEFQKELEGDEFGTVKKYKTRNLLPYAIIYKYLVKWYYYKTAALFKRVLKDDTIDVPEEIKALWREFVQNFSDDDYDVALAEFHHRELEFKFESLSDGEKILLIEGRLDDIKKEYSPEVPENYIDYMSQNDPSGNNKYLAWVVKTFTQQLKEYPYFKPEWYETQQGTLGTLIHEILQPIDIFHKNIQSFKQKDINQYNLESLKQAADEVLKSVKAKSQQKIQDKDVRVIFDDGHNLVVVPHTWEASKKYGSGAKWCTAYERSDSYFKQYKAGGELYYFINRKNDGKEDFNKIAIYAKLGGKFQAFNQPDANMPLETVKDHFPQEAFAAVQQDFKVVQGEKSKEAIKNPRYYIMAKALQASFDDLRPSGEFFEGMPVYTLRVDHAPLFGEEGKTEDYVIGTSDEMDEAADRYNRESAEGMVDDLDSSIMISYMPDHLMDEYIREWFENDKDVREESIREYHNDEIVAEMDEAIEEKTQEMIDDGELESGDELPDDEKHEIERYIESRWDDKISDMVEAEIDEIVADFQYDYNQFDVEFGFDDSLLRDNFDRDQFIADQADLNDPWRNMTQEEPVQEYEVTEEDVQHLLANYVLQPDEIEDKYYIHQRY